MPISIEEARKQHNAIVDVFRHTAEEINRDMGWYEDDEEAERSDRDEHGTHWNNDGRA